ncbi:MAG: response regulator [Bacteroidota bacterium]
MDEADKKNKKILVVDDNLLNRKLACAILKNNSFDFDIAENGKIAYDLFLEGDYDIILMDIQMPIMNGIESAKKIRAYERDSNVSSPVPIIAVTTFTRDSDKQNCYDAEINEVLGKPYKTNGLLEVLDRYI